MQRRVLISPGFEKLLSHQLAVRFDCRNSCHPSYMLRLDPLHHFAHKHGFAFKAHEFEKLTGFSNRPWVKRAMYFRVRMMWVSEVCIINGIHCVDGNMQSSFLCFGLSVGLGLSPPY
jgi:hypothetical protein